jgi:DNA-binding transcriptional MerR regulator
LFKISDFSKLCQVSTRTLRYYEEVDLLSPAYVDQFTGYRYYTIDQLPRLNEIIALKDLGFELAQIVDLLSKDISPEQIHKMLAANQREVELRIRADQERLGRIMAQMRLLEFGGSPQNVVIKKVEAQTVISCSEITPDFTPRFDLAQRVLALAQQHDLKPLGPTHYIYHPMEGDEGYTNVEAALPIRWSDKSYEVEVHSLSSVETMATLLYQGNPYSIFEAYQSLAQWIAFNNCTIVGPSRKVCWNHQGDFAQYLTEIQFPIQQGEMHDPRNNHSPLF